MVARHYRVSGTENILGQLLQHVRRPRGRRRLAPFTRQSEGELEAESAWTTRAIFRMQPAISVQIGQPQAAFQQRKCKMV